ncbi:bifunctional molybdenum cofactor biosynthesis protein MoaC/MoaB [Catellatospora chokoriensis]|uniref:bifunctional molybdenum cofactor biosynthesis protein MoaC/MoaB n=1 Tax=Catellatospora chokoriensis TaxID=310353 RepID=UPI0023B2860E|nr:bifunctional molybdenum cofactor biosynthesis protein MoaC/MoaB [Catellatospora chokoriensis]
MTHVDARGEARMVDVAGKEITLRVAVAAGRVVTTRDVLDLLRGQGVPKGDALGVARLAGIMAAKRTPDLIPLCHPIAIHGVTVDLTVTDDGVDIQATVRTADRTGVEMEALTSVAAAGLALIDMIKAVDPAASIDAVRVLRKEGGKTGLWERGAMPAVSPAAPASNTGAPKVRVIVASTRAATGVYEDRGGPLLADGLRAFGCEVGEVVVVPDGEPVREALRAALAERPDAVVTTGGTGISPTDRTPDITRDLIDYEVPGIADAVRGSGATPLAALSRGVTGVAGRTLVVNLPGSTGGVRDGVAVLAQVLPHAVEQLRGADHPASAGPGAQG